MTPPTQTILCHDCFAMEHWIKTCRYCRGKGELMLESVENGHLTGDHFNGEPVVVPWWCCEGDLHRATMLEF